MIRYAWLDIQVKKRKKNGSVVETFIKNQPLVSRVLEQPQLKFTRKCTVGYIKAVLGGIVSNNFSRPPLQLISQIFLYRPVLHSQRHKFT